MECRRALNSLDTNGYATFPRRKRYSWYHPGDSLQDRRTKMERRRTQLLNKYSEDEDAGNISIGEWIAVVKERDQLLKESVRQENEEAKQQFISELQHLLSDIPEFSPQTDKDFVRSVGLLKRNLHGYCAAHKITNSTQPVKRRESTSLVPHTSSPPKPPIPPNKPKIAPKKSIQITRSETTSTNSAVGSCNVHAINFREKCKVAELVKQSPTDEIDTNIKQKESATLSSAKHLPLVPPPPPPPMISNIGTPPQDKRRPSSCSLPNSNNSSLSLQEEITTHQKNTLRRVVGPKSPGGTPLRSLRTSDHTDILQRALMNKFRTVHIHSTPKRGGLMESGSVEISSTWSEWGASIDHHHYASDPDLTHFSTDLSTSPLPIAHSAADFDLSFSSPSLSS